ncbi:MAG: hypothetical protein IJM32_10945 [Ruminococcus sp.]|nr:hypothetical protein [Ruminococcus sp.]
MKEYALKMYYIKYLKEIRKVSDSTVKHYQEALRYISKYLVQKEKIKETIYEIQDIGELEIIKAYLYSEPDFVALDKRGHQMYSAGLNNYYKFATGQDFASIHDGILLLDTEVPVPDRRATNTESWKRSSIIKIQSIESAGFKCEINPEHNTFVSKSTGHPYMEGHHLLMMKYQEKFDKSLDVYANIVCLCPICHRLFHYGVEEEKSSLVDKVYHDRADRLASSGLRIGKEEFKKLTG